MKRKYSSQLLGQILLRKKVITKEQLEEAVEIRKKQRENDTIKLLGTILVELSYADEKDILTAPDEQTRIYQRVQNRRGIGVKTKKK